MPAAKSARLAYVDWMRGLACVLMFQTHCYDSWLSSGARKSTFFMWSQLGGTLPAPLFLFLAGVSLALTTEKLRSKGLLPAQIASMTIRRGAEIFGLGILFRLQEYLLAYPWAPWSDLLRVDILNTIGVSLMLMGATCGAVLWWNGNAGNMKLGIVASGVALGIALLTPPLWTTWRPRFLPWPIESYVNGVHNFGTPQAWLFPVFPWSGFAFAGLAVGFLLLGVKKRETLTFVLAGVAGIALIQIARWLDARPSRLYSVYDYWHTSPNFFLVRVGLLLSILSLVFLWCRWGPGQWGFSPLVQLGQTSLLVYWVHIEFVYGRFSILPKHAESIRTASFGLMIIFLAMLLLSILRVKFKGRGVNVRKLIGRPAPAC